MKPARLLWAMGAVMLVAACASTPPPMTEAQRLAGLLAESQQALRDEQRKVEQLQRQLREERRKAEEAQQKIESLRSIDKDMRKQRKESP